MGAVLNSGPPPKPADQRRRQNATPGMVQLPAEGYHGDFPAWPFADQTEAERMRWERVWEKPMAAMWIRMDIAEVVARYVRVCVDIENQTSVNIAGTNMHAEARQLEDRLGLSPMALLRLRWEIVPDEVAEKKEEKTSAKRRLKAVDPDAVSG